MMGVGSIYKEKWQYVRVNLAFLKVYYRGLIGIKIQKIKPPEINIISLWKVCENNSTFIIKKNHVIYNI